MYMQDLSAIIGLPAALKTTMEVLLTKLDWEGYITLSPRFRKSCCRLLKIKETTFRNRLLALTKYKMLVRESTNEYMVNPHFFARGEWKKILEQRSAFTLKVTYSEKNGRTITTERTEEQHELNL
jgi:hypothetical protein